LSDKRWNGTEVQFTPHNLALLPREPKRRYYNFYHLFNKKRFAKQSLMQILSMITYAVIFVCYLNVIRGFSGSSIRIVLVDGAVRLIIPIVIIFLDFRFKEFTRRLQFLLSLSKLLIPINICVEQFFSFDWYLLGDRYYIVIGWKTLVFNCHNCKIYINLISKMQYL
jgi:hypothetical protein